MCSARSEDSATLSTADRDRLLQTAHDAIAYALEHGAPLPMTVDDYAEPLRALRATFVTLHSHGQLRGCIGSLEAQRPLIEDVARNAHAAAFHDPRFTPLTRSELNDIAIHISILHPAEPLQFHSEADLLAQLRPGVDGLILREGDRRATFLPAVWETLPEPRLFWQQLKLKAGLRPDYWSDTLRVWRYTTESFP